MDQEIVQKLFVTVRAVKFQTNSLNSHQHCKIKSINCLDKLGWPTYDQDLLKEETKPFVIQINGKKRGLIEIKLDQSEKDIMNLIYQDNNLSKYLNKKEIKKKIFVPNKLMNNII